MLDEKLIALLRSLTPEEWEKPTIAKLWRVKDIAAHLLDGNFRMLSLVRDNYNGLQAPAIDSYRSLVGYLNELNAAWVNAAKRMSPRVITDLLESSGKEYCTAIAALPPFEEAIFPVSWAGEEVSQNWFHIAREYTEKWIHQQQIREAVNKPGLMEEELFYPFIDTFMRAWPYTYRDAAAPAGTVIRCNIDVYSWFLVKGEESWQLEKSADALPSATVDIPPAIAWKLFSKVISAANAWKDVGIKGDQQLGKKVLTMIAVMA